MDRNVNASLRAGLIMIAVAVFAHGPATGEAVSATAGDSSSEASLQAPEIVAAEHSAQQSSGSPQGTGLYLRAGMGLERSRGTRFLDDDCNPSGYAALYGCGSGPDGEPYQARGNFGSASGFEVGIGYAPASSFLRIEALIQHRPSLQFRGKANFLQAHRRQDVHVRASALAVMLAAYLDLPEIELRPIGVITPFVGAGIGQARIRTENMVQEYPATRTLVPGGSRTGFAWMASTGISAPLSKRVAMEFAWRYTDLGTVVTGRGAGRVVWRDGSREPLLLNLTETEADLESHGLWISLRYAF